MKKSILGWMVVWAVLSVVGILMYGCTPLGTPTTQPSPTTASDVYNTTAVIVQNAEAIAADLAAAGIIPQIDVTLGTNLLNAAMTAWATAMNPPPGVKGDFNPVTKQAQALEYLHQLQALNRTGVTRLKAMKTR